MQKSQHKKIISPWSDEEIGERYDTVVAGGKLRNYEADIIARLERLPANTNIVESYGEIYTPHGIYVSKRVTVGDLGNGKPNILITAGVHGYEPSGVEAAMRFLEKDAQRLSDKFNFVVFPCISPWAFEYDQRWNWQAEDVNRNFSRAENILQIDECVTFMNAIERSTAHYACAIDLHETNDKDILFRQLRAERFGKPLSKDYKHIPQGAYLILTDMKSDWKNELQKEFGHAVMNRVADHSLIAADEILMDVPNQGGIVLAPATEGLTRSFLAQHARYVAVTEIYPDHVTMGPEKAVQTQLAAIHGALEYLQTA
jgi:hypothetical protein